MHDMAFASNKNFGDEDVGGEKVFDRNLQADGTGHNYGFLVSASFSIITKCTDC
jgi:hypothetical protein